MFAVQLHVNVIVVVKREEDKEKQVDQPRQIDNHPTQSDHQQWMTDDQGVDLSRTLYIMSHCTTT